MDSVASHYSTGFKAPAGRWPGAGSESRWTPTLKFGEHGSRHGPDGPATVSRARRGRVDAPFFFDNFRHVFQILLSLRWELEPGGVLRLHRDC